MEFHPQVAAVLNVAPDHLDRYDSFEDYAAAKRNLLRNQQPGDVFVYPAGDRRLEDWARAAVGTPYPFGLEESTERPRLDFRWELLAGPGAGS